MKTNDPLLQLPSNIVHDGDFFLLAFADGRQHFAQALKQKSCRGKHAPCKVNKKSYNTYNLIGLPYGTVLELGSSGLIPLAEGEDVMPSYPDLSGGSAKTTSTVPTTGAKTSNGASNGGNHVSAALEDEEANADDSTFPAVDVDPNDDKDHSAFKDVETINQQVNDNRNIVDNNQSQALDPIQIQQMIEEGAHGSHIVDKLIENSSSFAQKTDFSKAKYVARKQKKYQPRCRMVRCTPATVCEALFLNKPRQLMNMREDTLGQILSYSNVSAGCQVLVYEQCMGVLTGSLAHRMGGYGNILSVYETQQPSYLELIQRFNLSFAEQQTIKWIHSGDIFGDEDIVMPKEEEAKDEESEAQSEAMVDPEKAERESLTWPVALQDHTRSYLEGMATDQERKQFLNRRQSRFARKLTRPSTMECNELLRTRKCDSIILAVRYNPTATLLRLLPFLAPSAPFVIYCEFIEPLTECFHELQKRKLAINLRLSDTWMREYQVLPGRTHPSMNMTQSGGFLLVGIKLDPIYGCNEMDEEMAKEIRKQIGGRRGKKPKAKRNAEVHESDKNNKKKQRI